MSTEPGSEPNAPEGPPPSPSTQRFTPEQLAQYAAQAPPPVQDPTPPPPTHAAPPQAPPQQHAPQQYAPQAPQQYAPQAPQQYAPQAPQQYAPQAPQQYAPQAPQQYAPQAPQHYAGHPPQQYAQHPQAQQTGVELKTSFFVLAFVLLLFPPTLAINGYEQKIKWGTLFVPLQPGQYRLECWFNYLFFGKVGRSYVDIAVHPGTVQRWQWSAPFFIWSKGKWKPLV